MARQKKVVSATDAAYARYEQVYAEEAKINKALEVNAAGVETLAAERAELEERLTAIGGNAAPQRKTKASKGKSGETRGRSSNGSILPFLLKNVSADKSKPTDLETLDNKKSNLAEPVTTAAKPRVVIMQNLSNNSDLFKRVGRGVYALTAKGVKARDGKKAASKTSKKASGKGKTSKPADKPADKPDAEPASTEATA